MINEKASAEIFKDLMNGKLINKRVAKDNVLVENSLYNEIYLNESEYSSIYRKIGFTLIVDKDYYYLTSEHRSNNSELRTKIITTMILLFRFVTRDKGYSADYLKHSSYGLSAEDIEELDNSEYRLILQTGESKTFIDALNLLKERNIVYQNLDKNYVLTDGGMKFFDDYIKTETVFSFD